MSDDALELLQTKVSKAIEVVITSGEKKRKNDVLADDVENVQLQICLKKIPTQNKTSKISLPNSPAMPDLEVCLFVKDLDKDEREFEATVNHFQELLSDKGVSSITEIIPLKSLRLEYQPFEAKKNLSNAYDKYLADERIVKFLPRLLGKHFYGEKKNPVQVNLQSRDLVKEINRALNTCMCTISGKGSSSMVPIGHTGMSQEDLVRNVIALGEQLSDCVPGGINNIKKLLLKSKSSVAVPIYMTTGGPQDVFIPKEKDDEDEDDVEEITTIMDAKVKVFRNGRVLVIRDGETVQAAMKRDKIVQIKTNELRKRKTPTKFKSDAKRQKRTKPGK